MTDITVHWFGAPWGAPLNDDCPQDNTPVGIRCLQCSQPIGPSANSGASSRSPTPTHHGCLNRSRRIAETARNATTATAPAATLT